MGLLNFFAKPVPMLARLPSGCFTVDRTGKIVSSTLPQAFPAALMQDIATHVLDTFREAQAAHLAFGELVVHFASLKLVARELHGGAIVFLTPQAGGTTPH
jgi:hypothetical protein